MTSTRHQPPAGAGMSKGGGEGEGAADRSPGRSRATLLIGSHSQDFCAVPGLAAGFLFPKRSHGLHLLADKHGLLASQVIIVGWIIGLGLRAAKCKQTREYQNLAGFTFALRIDCPFPPAPTSPIAHTAHAHTSSGSGSSLIELRASGKYLALLSIFPVKKNALKKNVNFFVAEFDNSGPHTGPSRGGPLAGLRGPNPSNLGVLSYVNIVQGSPSYFLFSLNLTSLLPLLPSFERE